MSLENSTITQKTETLSEEEYIKLLTIHLYDFLMYIICNDGNGICVKSLLLEEKYNKSYISDLISTILRSVEFKYKVEFLISKKENRNSPYLYQIIYNLFKNNKNVKNRDTEYEIKRFIPVFLIQRLVIFFQEHGFLNKEEILDDDHKILSNKNLFIKENGVGIASFYSGISGGECIPIFYLNIEEMEAKWESLSKERKLEYDTNLTIYTSLIETIYGKNSKQPRFEYNCIFENNQSNRCNTGVIIGSERMNNYISLAKTHMVINFDFNLEIHIHSLLNKNGRVFYDDSRNSVKLENGLTGIIITTGLKEKTLSYWDYYSGNQYLTAGNGNSNESETKPCGFSRCNHCDEREKLVLRNGITGADGPISQDGLKDFKPSSPKIGIGKTYPDGLTDSNYSCCSVGEPGSQGQPGIGQYNPPNTRKQSPATPITIGISGETGLEIDGDDSDDENNQMLPNTNPEAVINMDLSEYYDEEEEEISDEE